MRYRTPEALGMAVTAAARRSGMDVGRLTRDEIGRVFGAVLEDAGVFKWDEAGRAALRRFIASL